MKVIILAGGSGTRLWPLSRTNFPKQFLKLKNNRLLFQMTVERSARLAALAYVEKGCLWNSGMFMLGQGSGGRLEGSR